MGSNTDQTGVAIIHAHALRESGYELQLTSEI